MPSRSVHVTAHRNYLYLEGRLAAVVWGRLRRTSEQEALRPLRIWLRWRPGSGRRCRGALVCDSLESRHLFPCMATRRSSTISLVDPTELCTTCGEFVGDGHMTGCPDWRVGQALSWERAVLEVLRSSPQACSVDDLLTGIRLRNLRSFRDGSPSAKAACRRAILHLLAAGTARRCVTTGRLLPV